ncbi:hypothetical protein JYQ62_08305 [Nostoc sp. UHCC 0702]|nr:hypothetical protein JYQ62_08305 [Nostoc sp. UHCC 0702]
MSQIKQLTVQEESDDDDYLILQNPGTGKTYCITKANFLAGLSSSSTISTWCSLLLTETTGTAAIDSSGNGRNGTYVNCTLDSTGVIFNGSSRVSLNNSNAALSNFSIGIDFKTSFNFNQGLWEFRASQDLSSGTFTPALTMNSAGNIAVYGYPSSSGYSSQTFKDNNWHKCIAILANGSIKVIVDKIKILDVSANPITVFNGFFSIGATRANGNFNGQLKNFRIWNQDISEATAIQYT